MESQHIVNTQPSSTPRPFMFTGQTRDYYRIYVSNVVLSILTLGIYSAWAKVRNRRFFYGNTTLMGHAFDYDARPIAILIARLIFLPLFLLISFGPAAGPVWETIASIVLFLWVWLLPVIIVRSRAFNARYTVHRSVRFRYRKIYWPYYRIWIINFVASFVLTLGFIGFVIGVSGSVGEEAGFLAGIVVGPLVLAPFLAYVFRAFHRIQINQLGFGTLAFRYTARIGSYIKIITLSMLCFILLTTIFMVLLGLAYPDEFERFLVQEETDFDGQIAFFLLGAIAVSFIFSSRLYRSMMTPIFWSAIVSSDGSKLISTLRPLHYLVTILLLNLVLSIITLGAYIPWARVRNWHYLAAHTMFVPSAQAEEVLATHPEDLSPLAEALGDMGGLDFDFGV